MSLPQKSWDIIRNDPRFKAATKDGRTAFIKQAVGATWNMSHQVRKAERIFRDALDDAFGPLPATEEQRYG